jgi:hypothetical protein
MFNSITFFENYYAPLPYMNAPKIKLTAHAKCKKMLIVMIQTRGKKTYIPYGLP